MPKICSYTLAKRDMTVETTLGTSRNVLVIIMGGGGPVDIFDILDI